MVYSLILCCLAMDLMVLLVGQCNFVWVVITIDDILSGVDHLGLNLVRPLAMTVYGINRVSVLYYKSHRITQTLLRGS
jgi:hypothetical protein